MLVRRCNGCGHREAVRKHVAFKAVGFVVSSFGIWAWFEALFADTGIALRISVVVVVVGIAIAAFSNDLAARTTKNTPCPKCGSKAWTTFF